MDFKNISYTNLISSIAILFIAGFIYNKLKLNIEIDDRSHELNIIKKYLLNENTDNNNIHLLSSINKPILWVPIIYDKNSRKWDNFGSRNTFELNQDYLYLTIRSIINKCGNDFHIILIDDSSYSLLLEDWDIQLNKLSNPQKEYFRLFALVKLLYKYGGLLIEPSFIIFKSLKPIYDKIIKTSNISIAEFPNNSNYSHIMNFMPSTKFMGCIKNCPKIKEFHNYLQILFSNDYTEQINIENLINKWFYNNINNQEINYIDGKFIGTKDSKNKFIDLDKLFSSFYLDLNTKTYSLYIPHNELLKRHAYNWFVQLNTKQILESNTNIGKYLLLSNN